MTPPLCLNHLFTNNSSGNTRFNTRFKLYYWTQLRARVSQFVLRWRSSVFSLAPFKQGFITNVSILSIIKNWETSDKCTSIALLWCYFLMSFGPLRHKVTWKLPQDQDTTKLLVINASVSIASLLHICACAWQYPILVYLSAAFPPQSTKAKSNNWWHTAILKRCLISLRWISTASTYSSSVLRGKGQRKR